MFIALYVFLGFLLFDCLFAGCLYFRKERLFDTPEIPLNRQKTVKLSGYGKPGLAAHFVRQSAGSSVSDLSA